MHGYGKFVPTYLMMLQSRARKAAQKACSGHDRAQKHPNDVGLNSAIIMPKDLGWVSPTAEERS